MSPAAPLLLGLALLVLPGPPGLARIRGLGVPVARRLPHLPLRLLVPLAGGAVGALLLGVAGAVVGAGAAELLRRRRVSARGRTEATRTATELADALARIVEELRTGAHPATALDGVRADGPRAAAVLEPAAAAARLGDDVPAALRRASATAGPVASELDRLADAWGLADRYGAPLAALLGGALADLRWRLAFDGRVRARLAGPRATAAVLTLLPLLGIGLGHLMGADPLGVLRSGWLGQLVLLVGAALLLAGVRWSDHLATGPVLR